MYFCLSFFSEACLDFIYILWGIFSTFSFISTQHHQLSYPQKSNGHKLNQHPSFPMTSCSVRTMWNMRRKSRWKGRWNQTSFFWLSHYRCSFLDCQSRYGCDSFQLVPFRQKSTKLDNNNFHAFPGKQLWVMNSNLLHQLFRFFQTLFSPLDIVIHKDLLKQPIWMSHLFPDRTLTKTGTLLHNVHKHCHTVL